MAEQPTRDAGPGAAPRVAVVSGASRGAGRGIAAVLGERGYVVYVTGRSTRARPAPDGTPGTVEETAEEVTRRGGLGVAVACDHRDDADVERLFARVRAERGRLDLVVNNAWAGYERYQAADFVRPFWEVPTTYWERFFEGGVRMHLVTSRHALPLLLDRGGDAGPGLLVSTVAWDRDRYLGSWYDVAKHAIVRSVRGLAIELRGRGVAAVALAPGFMRTERVLATPARDWPGGVVDLSATESPEYAGRAVAALADDPRLLEKSGRAFRVGDLAAEYGFTDVDGRRVPPFALPDDGAVALHETLSAAG